MEIITVDIDKVIPYENNPRNNDSAVDAVAESIKQCGYISPIIVDENMVVLAGHTRLKALKQLSRDEVQVIVKEGLSEEQKRKYRILDNKTGEFAEWDFEKLEEELEGLDFGDFDFKLGAEGTGTGGPREGDFSESDFNYENKYAVTVMCSDEADQEAVYNRLTGEGYTCKVVTV